MTRAKKGPAAKRARSGPTIPEDVRRARGRELLAARVSEGYSARLRALAHGVGMTIGEQLEALIDAEERRR
jgi:hypothetical protein